MTKEEFLAKAKAEVEAEAEFQKTRHKSWPETDEYKEQQAQARAALVALIEAKEKGNEMTNNEKEALYLRIIELEKKVFELEGKLIDFQILTGDNLMRLNNQIRDLTKCFIEGLEAKKSVLEELE